MQRPTTPSASPSRSRPDSESGHRSASHARSYMSHRSSRAASPSPSPSRSRTPSQSRSPSRSRRSSSRPSSSRHNRSLSRHSSSRQSSSQHGPSKQEQDHNRGKLIKDSAGLLLGIGVAAIVAHKFWPKGMIYGGKEEWETRVDKAADKVKDKVKDKVFGQDDDDQDDRYRERYPPPRRGNRGRSRDRMMYYESDRLAMERGPEPPLLRSRSMRDREVRGRSLDPPRRRVYQEVDTTRVERYVPRQQQDMPRARREQTYASDRYYYQRGDSGQYVDRDDDIIVVEREGSRRGGRGYR